MKESLNGRPAPGTTGTLSEATGGKERTEEGVEGVRPKAPGGGCN